MRPRGVKNAPIEEKRPGGYVWEKETSKRHHQDALLPQTNLS